MCIKCWVLELEFARCCGHPLTSGAVKFHKFLLWMKKKKKLSEMIWQNFSSKTYLMAFKFGDGRECESGEREGEREGGGEEQRETHVKEILHAACQNVGIKH